MLPATIQDDIVVTKRLGLRSIVELFDLIALLTYRNYLWVNRLCIVQDDYESKDEMLKTMSSVNALANITIVAASGSSAESGLSGI